jgi:hypothetical protein
LTFRQVGFPSPPFRAYSVDPETVNRVRRELPADMSAPEREGRDG